MSTKQQTNQSSQSNLQYDPNSLNRYQSLTGAGANVLQQYMKNPLNNSFFRMGASQAQAGANKLGQQNINAFNQNYLTSGFGGNAGAAFKTAQGAQIGRANQALRSQAQIANIMQAYQRQLGATGQAMSFNPLMTGTSSTGQSTQTTGGLGTWLPQLAGAAIGAGMGAMTGGASMGLGAMGSSVAGGLPASATSPLSAFNIPSSGFGSMPSSWSNFQPQMPSFNPLSMGYGYGS